MGDSKDGGQVPGSSPTGRRPRPWQVGTDPDYRFTLANERTFLAWIRTSLALVAAGVAVVQITPDLGPRALRVALGVVLVVTAAAMAIAAHYRWSGNERAMRLGRSLPSNKATALLAYGLAAVAVTVLVLLLISRPA